MPIKPENKARYPKDWPAISARIRMLAGNICENCRLGNGWIGYRNESGEFVRIADSGKAEDYAGHATGYRVFRIVLTVAHLNHQPEDCRHENLKAWCQKCHLAYDKDHHQRNAAETRKARKASSDLFEAQGDAP